MFRSNVFGKIPLFRRQKKRFPKHIAFTVEDNFIWEKKNNKTPDETFLKRDQVVMDIVSFQIKMNIPLVTVFLLPEGRSSTEEQESLTRFFENLLGGIIHEKEVKISVLGKWYGLSGALVEEIKKCIDETKNYDRFFLNFCINYDGQSEIVDACRLICRRVKAGSIELEDINKELIKENLYSSYFLAPDIIIKTGKKRTWPNLLLWDSAGAYYFYSGKLFNDLAVSDIEKAMEMYSA